MLLLRHTRRREFIAGLGGAAAAWPLAGRAQQPAVPLIGFLHSASAAPFAQYVTAFQQGLGQTGFIIGRNVVIEYRWADDQYDRLPALTADLVRRQVAVIVASGPPAAQTAKVATPTIPIVFLVGADPVDSGLVSSLNRPAGNLTGVGILINVLVTKQLEMLHQLLSRNSSIGVFVNPDNPSSGTDIREIGEAARALGHQLLFRPVRNDIEIDAGFTTLVQEKTSGLVVVCDPLMISRRDQLVALAARYAIPAVYPTLDHAAAGGLMGYGISLTDAYHQVGIYAGRILKGEKPADLPVQLPTKIELAINMKTAKALGLTIPTNLLVRADEVIE
jgi:putative ABC transport system substrate-binding protein